MVREYRKTEFIEPVLEVLKHWWFILLITIVGIGFTIYFVTQFIEPAYKASTTLFIGKEDATGTGISFNDMQVGYQLIMDYQQLIQTDLVAEEVIKDLKLNMTPEDFRKNLSVETIDDSRFMHVSYMWSDSALTGQIANKLSEVLMQRAEEIVGVQNIQIVDYAKTPKAPISPNVPLDAAIGGLVGFILSIFIIALQLMLVNTVQEAEEIEKVFGLPVLGVIPKLKGRVDL